MKKALRLPILFNNDTTLSLSECGIEFGIDSYDVKYAIFYNVDVIYPHPDHEDKYSYLIVGGDSYTITMSCVNLEKVIEKWMDGWIQQE